MIENAQRNEMLVLSMVNNARKLIFCVLITVLCAASSSLAQKTIGASQKVDLAQIQLENVSIEEESMGELLAHFSFKYDIPMVWKLRGTATNWAFTGLTSKKEHSRIC
jgi:hypothetical protein